MRRARELLAQVDRVDSEIVSESGSEIVSESVSKSVNKRMGRGGRNFAPAGGFGWWVEGDDGFIGDSSERGEKCPRPGEARRM